MASFCKEMKGENGYGRIRKKIFKILLTGYFCICYDMEYTKEIQKYLQLKKGGLPDGEDKADVFVSRRSAGTFGNVKVILL